MPFKKVSTYYKPSKYLTQTKEQHVDRLVINQKPSAKINLMR
jgi:hypothetical protein